MGTDEECMGWVKDEIGRVVGLPRELGGIPLDEIGATGFGLKHAVDVAQEFCRLNIKDARFVIQGFGAVGKHAAKFLCESGAMLVAASDTLGAIHNPEGLDVDNLIALKTAGKSVTEYDDGKKLDGDAIIDIECEIWIPAARPDVVHEDNVHRLNTKMVVQGANIPITYAAEKILHEKGILNVPDFIANAGGVICAATEYQGAERSGRIRRNRRKIAP